ncbi:MAG: TRAP-type C4-dicarboxylate transport system, periplasmic component [Firmicutes bacterium]|nr:TRAP-type C4-dicarboxylate transport system, periplasmic component [Bacillota bacterium]
MKKTNLLKVLLSLLLVSSLLLVGCSKTNESETSSNSKGAEKTLKLAFTVPMDDAGGVGASKFKEVLEAESNGKLKVNLFPAGQQGSMKEHWEGCQLGGLEVVYVAGSALETFVPEEAILDLPFLFPSDYETAWKIIDGKLSEELNKLMNAKGFELLGIAPYGYNQFHTSKKAINSMKDLQGLKMRIIPSPLKIYQYEQWGANPTPIEFSELYTALQQGVVDGGENALSVIKTQKLHEVQKYITISDHALFMGLLTANKGWYDSLSDEEKAWLQAAAKANIEAQREFVATEREKIIEFFKEYGVNVTYLTDEARQEFIQKSASTHQKYASKSNSCEMLLNLVYDELEKYGIKSEN